MPAVKKISPARLAAAISAPVVLSVVLSSCGLDLSGGAESDASPSPSLSVSPLDSPTPAAEERAPELEEYYTQDVSWEDCRTGMECATVEVPLDYAEPGAEAIELSLLRVPARNQKQRVGSLVVNPGGPGGSGVDYAARAESSFGAEVRQVFDIVGFDPRGVGESTPIQCLPDNELDDFVASDPDPDNARERRQADRALAEFGRGCIDESGDLAAHISTAEAARDIDIIREVLDDRRLSYFGASYGTFLGATYADLYPQNVGRMVLDGAIDPSISSKERNLVQARGFETALQAYVASCVEKGDCFLGGTVEAGTQRIQQFLEEVEQEPLPGSGGRELRVGNAVLGIWAPLYNEDYWRLLDSALQAAFRGDGASLLALSDAYTSRGQDGYLDNSVEALYAVNCLDDDESIPVSEVPAHIDEFRKVSPTFGSIFAYSLSSCSTWPVSSERQPGPIDAGGAAPILVIGTSRDPATPLEWAESLAEQLDSGVLVRRDGDGHTGYSAGNGCVDGVVESYLVSGQVPDSDVDC